MDRRVNSGQRTPACCCRSSVPLLGENWACVHPGYGGSRGSPKILSLETAPVLPRSVRTGRWEESQCCHRGRHCQEPREALSRAELCCSLTSPPPLPFHQPAEVSRGRCMGTALQGHLPTCLLLPQQPPFLAIRFRLAGAPPLSSPPPCPSSASSSQD